MSLDRTPCTDLHWRVLISLAITLLDLGLCLLLRSFAVQQSQASVWLP